MDIDRHKSVVNLPLNAEELKKNKATQTAELISVSQNDQSVNKAEHKRSDANVLISSQGKLVQEIDETSNKIDNILEKHLSKDQKAELDSIYKKLDGILDKDNLTREQEDSVSKSFEKIHNIYESSVDKLSNDEHETVEKLSKTINTLTAKLDAYDDGKANQDMPTQSVRDKDASYASVEIGGKNTFTEAFASKKKTNKKALTVAQLNALSVAELNKLPRNQLKKLNSKQLNKLNADLLNSLSLPQLKQLSSANVAKLNQAQKDRLA